jgi:hypothetical protein
MWTTGAAGVVRAASAAGADVVIPATNAAVSALAPAVSAIVLDLRMGHSKVFGRKLTHWFVEDIITPVDLKSIKPTEFHARCA